MILPLSPHLDEPAEMIGGKARGLVTMMRLGLAVPAGWVIPVDVCRAYLTDGRLSGGLVAELAAAVRGPVSVRSGASVSMPGMMSTLLDVSGEDLGKAVEAVFASWDTPRARTYRVLHDIPHGLGTAVTIQTMVYGERGGSGVAFSRDPNTGEPGLYGEVLLGRRGDAVVSGGSVTEPLSVLPPGIGEELSEALGRLEGHYRDACHVEFTFEDGRLWFLQVRPGGLAGRAAIRVAVDLAEEGTIDRRTALLRVEPSTLASARTPRLAATTEIVARGVGACPGVASGRVATTSDGAVRMAADGPVILVRPETSPLDMHGLAAAAGVVTARGGPTCHAAVVARSMGKPAVVGVGSHDLAEGQLVTIDGTAGVVAPGSVASVVTDADPQLGTLLGWAAELAGEAGDEVALLTAARAVLQRERENAPE
ncbi:PEP/pyruvate-binding domain-containing protein [Nonomuraea soli]|uniref:Phosphoenolpyruvate synthase/pyruvate phosphate dikinase n=1 Tax=Nonomuraea soli TaxID=1032476 RepID=A0A7W0CUW5_9ACTN|nr:PEP/pyruvate-binding domain-containing protein [Nonomuraea soli]MBA2897618.1 phosphoenolpyruvate synthase/pyruvate phosphate dikinase [Nonomuraea soli]